LNVPLSMLPRLLLLLLPLSVPLLALLANPRSLML
jgi:hypothetical protein